MTHRIGVIATAFLCLVIPHRAIDAQSVGLGTVAMSTAHRLMSDGLFGFGAHVGLPLGSRLAARGGAEHVTGTANRRGIMCVGLVQPGTCISDEPIRDDARLTAATGGVDLRLLGSDARKVALTADVRIAWVHAESYGATSGAKLSNGKSLIGGEVGLLAVWSLSSRSPFAFEAGASAGVFRPVIKEQIVDGYNPFWTDFNVARLRVGGSWRPGGSPSSRPTPSPSAASPPRR